MTCAPDHIREGYSEEETAEFDQPATIDAIEETLQSLGYRTDRIGHVRALARRLVVGERWDLVFNIAEGLKGFGREAQSPACSTPTGSPSGPSVALADAPQGDGQARRPRPGDPHARLCRGGGCRRHRRGCFPFPLVKPVSEGTGKGIDGRSIVRDRPNSIGSACRCSRPLRSPFSWRPIFPDGNSPWGLSGQDAGLASSPSWRFCRGNRRRRASTPCSTRNTARSTCATRSSRGSGSRTGLGGSALAAWRGLECRDGGRLDIRADAAGRPRSPRGQPPGGAASHALGSSDPVDPCRDLLPRPSPHDHDIRGGAARSWAVSES